MGGLLVRRYNSLNMNIASLTEERMAQLEKSIKDKKAETR